MGKLSFKITVNDRELKKAFEVRKGFLLSSRAFQRVSSSIIVIGKYCML